MDSFTISEISRLTGIKAPTIRIWEQRYQVLRPYRSEGNTRYYSSNQLRRLLNIVTLAENGYKVSELAALPDDRLFDLMKQQDRVVRHPTTEYFINQLIAAGISFDETGFEKAFSHCLLRMGWENTYTEVLYPLLDRVGMMWATDDIPPIQEHFISNLVKQKIYTAIDSVPPARTSADTWILMTPENEFHEMGLLYSQYLIRRARKKVVYLGPNVPLNAVATGIKELNATNILLFLVHYNQPEPVQTYLKKLKSEFGVEQVYVAGNKKLLNELNLPKGVTSLSSAQSLQEVLGAKKNV